MERWIHTYRFELLLFALVMVIFNKILITNNSFYSSMVWPANMVLLGLVSLGVFHKRKKWEKLIRNLLFLMVISIPIAPKVFFSSDKWTIVSLLAYLFFYSFLFYSVMVQITQKKEVSESVIYGSLSGFLLLLVLATFSFLLLDLSIMDSFLHISGYSIPSKYHQFSYYSLITLTTIGYGDITPVSEQARLLAGFWGVVSQFYMVAIVGIIISKYTSK